MKDAEIRGSNPAVRQDRSAPILARINDWLAHHRARAYIAKYPDGFGRSPTRTSPIPAGSVKAMWDYSSLTGLPFDEAMA